MGFTINTDTTVPADTGAIPAQTVEAIITTDWTEPNVLAVLKQRGFPITVPVGEDAEGPKGSGKQYRDARSRRDNVADKVARRIAKTADDDADGRYFTHDEVRYYVKTKQVANANDVTVTVTFVVK